MFALAHLLSPFVPNRLHRATLLLASAICLTVACDGESEATDSQPGSDAGSGNEEAGDDSDTSTGLPPVPEECDGPPTTIASWDEEFIMVRQMQATEDFLYVSLSGEMDGLFRLPVTGGEPERLTDEGSAGFWVEPDSIVLADHGALYRMPLEGGTPAILDGHAPDPDEYGMCYVRDASHLYWTTGIPSVIKRVPIVGGPIETIFELEGTIFCPLGMDDEHLVFSDLHALYRMPKSGGATEKLFEGSMVRLLDASPPWIVSSDANEPGSLKSIVQLSDDAAPALLLSEQAYAEDVCARVDGKTFLMGVSFYSAPDGTTSRLSLFESQNGQEAHASACLSPRAFDPNFENGGQEERAHMMAASESAVYLASKQPGSSLGLRIAVLRP